jgi:hypothetical protein
MRIRNDYLGDNELERWLESCPEPGIGNRKQHALAGFEIAIDYAAYTAFAKFGRNPLKHR